MGSRKSSGRGLEQVVVRGRRRIVSQLAIRDACLGATVFVAGLAALAVAGTDYFPPMLLWLVCLGALAVGFFHWKRSRPSLYHVAQWLDSRWATEDQISTAYYFLGQPAQGGAFCEQQRGAASRLAAAGDVPLAFPFRAPRAAYWLAGLVALTLGLLGLRYAVQPALSLQPPLPPLLLEALFGADAEPPPVEPEALMAEGGDDSPLRSNEPGASLEPQRRTAEPSAEGAESLASNEPGQDAQGPPPEIEGLSLDNEYGDEFDYNSLFENAQDATPEPGAGPADPTAETNGDAASKGETPKPPEWDQQSNSLLDKLKDAFENMLSQLNIEPPTSGKGSRSASQQEASQGSDAPSDGSQSSEAGSETAGANASELQMEGGEGAEAASQQAAQGASNSDGSSQSGEGQTASGAGSDEGSKALEEAAQLEAMGKLEEIYSRRAEEIKGEVMVETDSVEQSARTPYRPQQASHRDRGGAISRDEIPLELQPYIKTYFENLRQRDRKQK